MIALSTRHQLLIGLLLVLLLAATRGHDFASLTHLPGASWSVFFLAGVYLRSWRVLPFLLALDRRHVASGLCTAVRCRAPARPCTSARR